MQNQKKIPNTLDPRYRGKESLFCSQKMHLNNPTAMRDYKFSRGPYPDPVLGERNFFRFRNFPGHNTPDLRFRGQKDCSCSPKIP